MVGTVGWVEVIAGEKVAVYDFTDTDAVVKGLQRIALNNDVGVYIDVVALLGALTETLPATDNPTTAGLNGLLKKVIQKQALQALQMPATLTGGGSFKIAAGEDFIPGVGATALGKAINTATGATDTGVGALMKRVDTTPATIGTNNAWVPKTGTAKGEQYTKDFDLLAFLTTQSTTGQPAGEAHIGEVGGNGTKTPFTAAVDTAIYASGDVLLATQLINGFFRKPDGSGYITDMIVVDKSDQKMPMTVFLFNSNVSLGTVNTAPNITDANLAAGCVAIIPVLTSDFFDMGGASVAHIKGISTTVKAVTGTDDLYIGAVLGVGTPTYAATDLVFTFGVSQD